MPYSRLNDEAVEGFRRSVESGRMAHAYLLVGAPRGRAMVFAEDALKSVLCSGDNPPCGECRACRLVGKHTHSDVLWVEPEKKSRVISIKQIRDLNRRIAESSYEGGWKAAVIVCVDRMKSTPANALLKTLEEPPPRTLLLLLTDSPQALLPTIISRCQRINLIGEEVIGDRPWKEGLLGILRQGLPGDALEAMALAEKLTTLLEVEKARIEEQDADDDTGREETVEVQEARIEAKLRESRAEIMHSILLWRRDLLLLSVAANEDQVHFSDEIETIRAQAAVLNYAQALNGVRAAEKMVTRLERNLPASAVFEEGFMYRTRRA